MENEIKRLIEELKKYLSLTEIQKQNVIMETDHLNNLKWYQRIFRNK